MIWWFLRHFQTSHNADQIPQGQKDIPLSPEGREKLKEFTQSHTFNPCPEIIYSSDLSRALETAQALSEHLKIRLIPDPRLREWNLGDREGVKLEEFNQKYPNFVIDYDDLDFRYPNGESKRELYQRLENFYLELLPKKEIPLIVSHRGAINCLICHSLKIPPQARMPFKLKPGGIAAVNPFAQYNGLLCYQGKLEC